MRIAIVGPAYPYKGGGAQHTTELAHRLAAAGHDVTIESWSAQYPSFLYPGQQTVDAPEGEPYPRTRRSLSWRRPDGWFRHGRRIGRSADLLILAVLSPVQVPAYLGILAGARRTGARTVALCHNVLPHERRAVDVTLMRTLLRRVDAVLTHSEEQANLAHALTTNRTPITVTALPPHLPGTPRANDGRQSGTARDGAGGAPGDAPEAPPDAAPGAPRPRPGASPGTAPGSPPGTASRASSGASSPPLPAEGVRRRLLFFGIVRAYKGLDVLLRALAQGAGDVRLTVAGEFWGGTGETERLIGELGLGGRVELRPGYVPAGDVPGLFAGADALVLPYRSATASQNAWLAFEHGVPVIATRVGALPDHVRDGVDGLLCAPGDAADLAKTIARFYTEPERLRAGVRRVDPGPYWSAYVDALLAS